MITVNGKEQMYAAESVLALLERLDFPTAAVAVERNGELLAKSAWEQQLVADGDVYEVIRFVGGG